ncbi:hypothetical protein [Vulcanisaeta sp. JCM 16161]|uniref:hypothetical protein n=1 Tax=Vulcanisaeta sp. JCM 16161 TaxID=1295372 RepID=UPI000B273B65|nr:hypothetical protein [Vulcanisaeta sp. JCM 16161]
MNVDRQVELFLMATLANALDLATSYLVFSLFGLQELNYYATAMHLSNYLAAALAFIAYEPRWPAYTWQCLGSQCSGGLWRFS